MYYPFKDFMNDMRFLFHFSGPMSFEKVRAALDQFQAPDDIYKAEPRIHDPSQMGEIINDSDALLLVISIACLIEENPKDGFTGVPLNLRMPFDALVRRFIYANMWLGDEEIGRKIIEKAVSYLKYLVKFKPYISRLDNLYVRSIADLNAVPIVQ